MNFQRLCALVSKMPRHLTTNDLTMEEALTVWRFLDAKERLPMTARRVKIQLANECGCFVEQLDAVGDNAHISKILTWESNDQSKGLNVDELMALAHNIPDEDWLLDLCRSMSLIEAEMFWRWALNYRWSSVRNRMVRWLRKMLHMADISTHDPVILLQALYMKTEVMSIEDMFVPLRPYTKNKLGIVGTSSEYWFVTDCSTLVQVYRGAVRDRGKNLMVDLMVDIPPEAPLTWCWLNPLQTNYIHSESIELPFSKYKEPLPTSWEESLQLLHNYPKGGFLIKEHGEYFLMSSGTVSLMGQLMYYKRVGDNIEFTLGFRDGLDVVDVPDIIAMTQLPFEIEQQLRKQNINVTAKQVSEPLSDNLTVKVEFTWSPRRKWHFIYTGLFTSYGLSDVDEIVDYISLVGENYATGWK
jgi:hypothetical protein|tara:strand:+ start:1146 stop:2384 length:1239 start_codon:yes stop_codon:yes gene_type:complete